MRLLLAILLGALLWASPVAAQPIQNSLDAFGMARAEGAAPGFDLPRLEGGNISLSDLRGRVVVLNFWATWCAPCREEMPDLEAAHRRFQDSGLMVLAVSEDRGKKKRVQRVADKMGLSFPVLLDPKGEVGRRYGVSSLPATVLIAADGSLIGQAVGIREWDGDAARKLFKTLLDGVGSEDFASLRRAVPSHQK